MVKSPKTGAYVFDEQMVPNEKVQDFSKNNQKKHIPLNCKILSLANNEGFFIILLLLFQSFVISL